MLLGAGAPVPRRLPAVTVGSGGSGGVFFPSLFMVAMAEGAFGWARAAARAAASGAWTSRAAREGPEQTLDWMDFEPLQLGGPERTLGDDTADLGAGGDATARACSARPRDRARPGRGRAGDRGPGAADRPAADRARDGAARADRGRAGAGEDAHRVDAGERAAPLVRADSVHAGPVARGHHGHADVQPARRRLPGAPGPAVRERDPRRRDQSCAREGAVGAAGGDAGAAGDDRRGVAPAAPAVLRAGDAEPDRARGHVPAARGAARPLHAQRAGRLPRA